ncbi:class I SAM-dependent methyltransferase [Lentilitoribacter sp. Alg239-R112]|uniref:class I SAM-dependent methyltransferase n=1 Tax=Lentilitoribacter sp. Alg239-R112 TaxID=2305987 RepID=UPI0013A703A9|nr:class I SAM-dependent methyltransferase [Lentilitoribacter sp. Alg239-R112]
MHPKYINKCRVCGSPILAEVVDLGQQCLQGAFRKEGVIEPPRRMLPTKLVRCDVTANHDACGLVQLGHTFPPEVLYSNYWYKSGTNQTMRSHLAAIVDATCASIDNRSNLTVLDIGCNDGTLLSSYPDGTKMFGVDPSDIANSASEEIGFSLANDVFPSEASSAVIGDTKFDIVTSIAMYYDLEDPVGFARDIKSVLKDDGIWVVEMSYMPLMLLQNSFDTICHEHLEYYSLAVLEYIFKQAELRVFKAEINDINGGSIRCYVTSAANANRGTTEDANYLRRLRMREFDMELDTEDCYARFRTQIHRLREETRTLLYDIRSQGKVIHIYGASTKGNVLLQWYGIDCLIAEAAADRNPDKDGAYTLGTDIPIMSEEKSRAKNPDYYLVLPWHFKREFLTREREIIDKGTQLIFPLPELLIVNKDNVDDILEKMDGSKGSQSMGQDLEALLWK